MVMRDYFYFQDRYKYRRFVDLLVCLPFAFGDMQA
jgi:hypothetical protein